MQDFNQRLAEMQDFNQRFGAKHQGKKVHRGGGEQQKHPGITYRMLSPTLFVACTSAPSCTKRSMACMFLFFMAR